jgi:hypothetical protein
MIDGAQQKRVLFIIGASLSEKMHGNTVSVVVAIRIAIDISFSVAIRTAIDVSLSVAIRIETADSLSPRPYAE